MKHLLAPAAISLAVLASPAAALDFGDAFRVTGNAAVGYDSLFSQGSYSYDISLGVPLSFGSFEAEAGLRVRGIGFLTGGLVFAPRAGLYASVSGQYGAIHAGFVQHATTAYLPHFDLYQAPAVNAIGPAAPPPFSPFLRFQENLAPPTDVVIRAEARYNGFFLAYSRSNMTPFSSVYASYDFDVAKVFAGADYASGTLVASYAGAEGSIGKFDLSGMFMRNSGINVTNLAATYNINDKFSVGVVMKNIPGQTNWGINGNYRINDIVKASVGYSRVSGGNYTSAQISVDLN